MLASALLVHFIRYTCTVSGSWVGCLNPEAVTTCNPHSVFMKQVRTFIVKSS